MPSLYLDSSITKRKTLAARAIPYGIGFLDDALIGIRPKDIVVLAAATGMGKTALGSMIAASAACLGKRTTFIALEAETYEIEWRLQFTYLAKLFFAKRSEYPNEMRLDFAAWMHDGYGDVLLELEQQAHEEVAKQMCNLTIVSPEITEFSKKDFSVQYEELSRNADLIVLDHIHYIVPDERENEYDHIKKVMWKLRDLVNTSEVPVVAISHLRKESRGDTSLVPGLAELHGSSEISKQANAVISFAPCYSVPAKDNAKNRVDIAPGGTLCKVLKARVGNPGCQRYMALMHFDLSNQSYDSEYVPYTTDRFSSEIYGLKSGDFEYWMRRARVANV